MDTKLQVLALTLAFIVILLPAQARAAKDCNIADLLSCMPCIRNTKPDPEPTDECCKALKKADLPCLCRSYKNSPNLKNYVNPKLAMELPGKCKLSVPNECHWNVMLRPDVVILQYCTLVAAASACSCILFLF